MRAIFAAALRENASYVDVGTNRGQLLAVAVQTAPRGRHLAFEPIPELAAEVNRRFPNVDCRRLALSSRPGTHEFWHFRRLDGWSGLVRNPTVSDSRGDPQRLQVEVSTLDAQLEGLTPALVKIDVEGAELEVLEGGRGVLGAIKPLLVVECVAEATSLYGHSVGQVWEQLDELGYEVLPVTGGAPVDRDTFGRPATVNWLARPRSNG